MGRNQRVGIDVVFTNNAKQLASDIRHEVGNLRQQLENDPMNIDFGSLNAQLNQAVQAARALESVVEELNDDISTSVRKADQLGDAYEKAQRKANMYRQKINDPSDHMLERSIREAHARELQQIRTQVMGSNGVGSNSALRRLDAAQRQSIQAQIDEAVNARIQSLMPSYRQVIGTASTRGVGALNDTDRGYYEKYVSGYDRATERNTGLNKASQQYTQAQRQLAQLNQLKSEILQVMNTVRQAEQIGAQTVSVVHRQAASIVQSYRDMGLHIAQATQAAAKDVASNLRGATAAAEIEAKRLRAILKNADMADHSVVTPGLQSLRSNIEQERQLAVNRLMAGGMSRAEEKSLRTALNRSQRLLGSIDSTLGQSTFSPEVGSDKFARMNLRSLLSNVGSTIGAAKERAQYADYSDSDLHALEQRLSTLHGQRSSRMGTLIGQADATSINQAAKIQAELNQIDKAMQQVQAMRSSLASQQASLTGQFGTGPSAIAGAEGVWREIRGTRQRGGVLNPADFQMLDRSIAAVRGEYDATQARTTAFESDVTAGRTPSMSVDDYNAEKRRIEQMRVMLEQWHQERLTMEHRNNERIEAENERHNREMIEDDKRAAQARHRAYLGDHSGRLGDIGGARTKRQLNELSDRIGLSMQRLGSDATDDEILKYKELRHAISERRGHVSDGPMGFGQRFMSRMLGRGWTDSRYGEGTYDDTFGKGRGGGSPFGRGYNSVFNRMNHMATNVSQLGGVSLYGLGLVGGSITAGAGTLRMAAELEGTKNALAGMTNTYTQFLDAQGKSVSNAENLNKSLIHSERLYDKIREKAKNSLLTTQELTESFLSGAPALRAKGFSEGQALDVVNQITMLGRIQNLSPTAIQSDIRDFAQGQVTVRSQVLRSAGLTPEGLKGAFKEGGPEAAYEYFTKALSGFKAIFDNVGNTIQGRLNKLKIELEKTGQEVGAALVPVLIPALERFRETLTQWAASGVAQNVAESLGSLLVSFIKFGSGLINMLAPMVGKFGVIGTGIIAAFAFMAAQMAVQLVAMRFPIVGILAAIGMFIAGLNAQKTAAEAAFADFRTKMDGPVDARSLAMGKLSALDYQGAAIRQGMYGDLSPESKKYQEAMVFKQRSLNEFEAIKKDYGLTEATVEQMTFTAGRAGAQRKPNAVQGPDGKWYLLPGMGSGSPEARERWDRMKGNYDQYFDFAQDFESKGAAILGRSKIERETFLRNEAVKMRDAAAEKYLKDKGIKLGRWGGSAWDAIPAREKTAINNRIALDLEMKYGEQMRDMKIPTLPQDKGKDKSPRYEPDQIAMSAASVAYEQLRLGRISRQLEITPDLAAGKPDMLLGRLGSEMSLAVASWRDKYQQAAEGKKGPFAYQIADIELQKDIEDVRHAFEMQLRQINQNIQAQKEQNDLMRQSISLQREKLAIDKAEFEASKIDLNAPGGTAARLGAMASIGEMENQYRAGALRSRLFEQVGSKRNELARSGKGFADILKNFPSGVNAAYGHLVSGSFGGFGELPPLMSSDVKSMLLRLEEENYGMKNTKVKGGVPSESGGQLGSFINAIIGQESGGNYNSLGQWVHRKGGKDRAYGKYQIMGANIPSWTKAALGHSMTPSQFLADRDAQDKVATWKLTQYFEQFGPEGAAKAWYAGPGNARTSSEKPQFASGKRFPSINQYAREVMARMGGGGKGGGSRFAGAITRGDARIAGIVNQMSPAELIKMTMVASATGQQSALLEALGLSEQSIFGDNDAAAFDAYRKQYSGAFETFNAAGQQVHNRRTRALETQLGLIGTDPRERPYLSTLADKRMGLSEAEMTFGYKSTELARSYAERFQTEKDEIYRLNPDKFIADMGVQALAERMDAEFRNEFGRMYDEIVAPISKQVKEDEASFERRRKLWETTDALAQNAAENMKAASDLSFDRYLGNLRRAGAPMMGEDLFNQGMDDAQNAAGRSVRTQIAQRKQGLAFFDLMFGTNKLQEAERSGYFIDLERELMENERKSITSRFTVDRLQRIQMGDASIQSGVGLIQGLTVGGFDSSTFGSAMSPLTNLLQQRQGNNYTKLLQTAMMKGGKVPFGAPGFGAGVLNMNRMKMTAMGNIVKNMAGDFLGNYLGQQVAGSNVDPIYSNMGTLLGGSLAAAGTGIFGAAGMAGMGSFAGPVGAIAGGLLGGVIGRMFGGRSKRRDPVDLEMQKKMVELLSRIDKSLRPQEDYFRTVKGDVLFGSASAWFSGRAYARLGLQGFSGNR